MPALSEHEHIFAAEGCHCGAQACPWHGFTVVINDIRYYARSIPPEWLGIYGIDEIWCQEEGPEACEFHRILDTGLLPFAAVAIIAEPFVLSKMLTTKVPKVRAKRLM